MTKEITIDAEGPIEKATILTLVFSAQKLTDQIDWPWWWCISPILGLLGIAVLIGIASFVLVAAKAGTVKVTKDE